MLGVKQIDKTPNIASIIGYLNVDIETFPKTFLQCAFPKSY